MKRQTDWRTALAVSVIALAALAPGSSLADAVRPKVRDLLTNSPSTAPLSPPTTGTGQATSTKLAEGAALLCPPVRGASIKIVPLLSRNCAPVLLSDDAGQRVITEWSTATGKDLKTGPRH